MSNKGELNIGIPKDLWNHLRTFAAEQTLLQGKRFAVIEALRMAVKVFLRLQISEINRFLDREPRAPSLSDEYQQPSPGQKGLSREVEISKKEEELDLSPQYDGSVVVDQEDPIRNREKIRELALKVGKSV